MRRIVLRALTTSSRRNKPLPVPSQPAPTPPAPSQPSLSEPATVRWDGTSRWDSKPPPPPPPTTNLTPKQRNKLLASSSGPFSLFSIYSASPTNAFTPINYCTLLSKLSKYNLSPRSALLRSPTFELILADIPPLLPSFSPRDLADLLYSLRVLNHATLDTTLPTADHTKSIINSIDYSLLLNAGSPRDQSNAAYSLAILSPTTHLPPFLASLDAPSSASKLAASPIPQDAANILYAAATISRPMPTLANALNDPETAADFVANSKKLHTLTSTLHSLSKLGHTTPHLFHALSPLHSSIITHASPQSVSNLAWSHAVQKHPSLKLFRAIDAAAFTILQKPRTTPQTICNLAWSAATLGHPAFTFFDALTKMKRKMPPMKAYAPGEMAMLAWAVGALEYEYPALLSEIEGQAERIVWGGTPQNVAMVAVAFATLGFEGEEFWKAFERHLERFLGQATGQGLCNICWSIVVLDLQDTTAKRVFAACVEAIAGSSRGIIHILVPQPLTPASLMQSWTRRRSQTRRCTSSLRCRRSSRCLTMWCGGSTRRFEGCR